MRKWIATGIAGIILILGVSGFLFRGALFNSEASAIANIRTAIARRDDITVSVNATGTVEPLLTVEVRSKASGAITNLHVEAGDTLELPHEVDGGEARH